LKNGGTIENAATMANHALTRTTQLYDRRRRAIRLDEVMRVHLKLIMFAYCSMPVMVQ
jgi:hypothetical protein